MAEGTSQSGLLQAGKSGTKDPEFSLTEEEMKKINYLGKLERRKYKSKVREVKRNKFSDNMSLEAQIAMQLAFKDTQAMKTNGKNDRVDESGNVSPHRNKNNHVKFADEPPVRPDTTCSKYSTYSEAFEKMGSVRMTYDLTDDQFEPLAARKRALDGMKVQNTLEMVEIVNTDEPNCADDDVINQIAQRNAVEKCLVWMEVLGPDGQPTTESKNTPQNAKSKTQGTSTGVTPGGHAMQ